MMKKGIWRLLFIKAVFLITKFLIRIRKDGFMKRDLTSRLENKLQITGVTNHPEVSPWS